MNPRWSQALALHSRGAHTRAWALYEGLAPDLHSQPVYWLMLAVLAEQRQEFDLASACMERFGALLSTDSVASCFTTWSACPAVLMAPAVQQLVIHKREALSLFMTCGPAGTEDLQTYYLYLLLHLAAHPEQARTTLIQFTQTHAVPVNPTKERAFCLGDAYHRLAKAYLPEQLTNAQRAAERANLLITDPSKQAHVQDLMGRIHLNLLALEPARIAFDTAARLDPHPFRQQQAALSHLPLQYGSAAETVAHDLHKQLETPVSFLCTEAFARAENGCFTFFHWNYTRKADLPLRQRYAQQFAAPKFVAPKSAPHSTSQSTSTPYRLGIAVTQNQVGLFYFGHRILLQQLLVQYPHLSIHLLAFGHHPLWAQIQTEFPELVIHRCSADYTHPRFLQQCNSLRALSLHWLYFWEVGTDTLSFFLPYLQLAPVQFTAWGSVSSTGHPHMDYFLTSRALFHHTETFSERCVQLPQLLYACEPERFLENTSTEPSVARGPVRIACLHNPRKNTPAFLQALKEIMTHHNVEVFMAHSVYAHWQQVFETQVEEALGPEYAKVTWLPRQSNDDFLHCLSTMDLMLDPFDFGAGKLAYESIFCALPVVTHTGQQLRSRIVSACYEQMGMKEGLWVESVDDYVVRARELIQDSALRQRYRQDILDKRGHWTTRALAKDFYNALLHML